MGLDVTGWDGMRRDGREEERRAEEWTGGQGRAGKGSGQERTVEEGRGKEGIILKFILACIILFVFGVLLSFLFFPFVLFGGGRGG